jgi:hypothetical protein
MLNQWDATRGPLATSGSPFNFMRPSIWSYSSYRKGPGTESNNICVWRINFSPVSGHKHSKNFAILECQSSTKTNREITVKKSFRFYNNNNNIFLFYYWTDEIFVTACLVLNKTVVVHYLIGCMSRRIFRKNLFSLVRIWVWDPFAIHLSLIHICMHVLLPGVDRVMPLQICFLLRLNYHCETVFVHS